jgi:CHAD domain-containing protein
LAYRFTAGESVSENVRRVATEQIQSAISELEKTDPKQREEAIHEARKSVKRLRALLRLVRPGLGRTFRQENTALRDIGRSLSDLRDSAILLQTFDTLAEEPSDRKKTQTVRNGLRREKTVQDETTDFQKSMRDAARALAEVGERVGEWPLTADGFDAIAEGLKAEYRGGRKAMPKALKKNDSLLFHEWRKRAKCQLFHVRLLQDLLGESWKEQEKQLHALESALGDDHNLLILRQHLKARAASLGGKKRVKQCIRLASEREGRLRSEAQNLGEKLYTQKPKAFLRNLRAEWEQSTNSRLPSSHPDERSKRKALRLAHSA